MRGLNRFRKIILFSLALLIAGVAWNEWSAEKTSVRLWLGMEKSNFSLRPANTKDTQESNPGFTLRLDSLRVLPFEKEYELHLRGTDTSFSKSMHPNMAPPGDIEDRFTLEPMKIRKVGKTEYRFRLRDFYPDFTFRYTYPDNQDTIPPRSPGITLDLVTREGPAVVTLREDQPGRDRLDDVVGLGYTLLFLWEAPSDTLLNRPDSGALKNKIIFAGKDRKVFYVKDGAQNSEMFKENMYYTIPGQDSFGFTVLQCFPDAALLKAEPATKSDSLVNPVARVEMWKKGGTSTEAYLYPEVFGRNSGHFAFPGENQILSLGLSTAQEINACHCIITLRDSISGQTRLMTLKGKQNERYKGYSFHLKECDTTTRAQVTLSIKRYASGLLNVLGYWGIGVLAVLFLSLLLVSPPAKTPAPRRGIPANEINQSET